MKRQIFVGDVQGHCDALERLLDKLKFDPAGDRLRMAGDLVNRGGQSLETLRLVRSLGKSAMTVLGNHDLHLLAYAAGVRKGQRHNPEFEAILEASDGQDLLDWLRAQPLMWRSAKRRLALVHAGLDPRWGPKAARTRARELEHALTTEPDEFFAHMYGNRPRRWRPRQPHYMRLRAITNVFTRLRFCDRDGRLDLDYKGSPEHAPKGVRPWFEFLHRGWQGWTVVFGHWSMLGAFSNGQVMCLDSGCVWGGELTALIVDGDERRLVAVDCNGRKQPG
jgi:bis(5'-nucleosyl)-tetraphosphatase (symmetrical)